MLVFSVFKKRGVLWAFMILPIGFTCCNNVPKPVRSSDVRNVGSSEVQTEVESGSSPKDVIANDKAGSASDGSQATDKVSPEGQFDIKAIEHGTAGDDKPSSHIEQGSDEFENHHPAGQVETNGPHKETESVDSPKAGSLINAKTVKAKNNSGAKADSGVKTKKSIDEFYDRVADDLKRGKPLVVTVYVALCDNDSQGIAPVRNKKICRGDFPENNLYWGLRSGLKAHLKTKRWKKLVYETSETDKIAVRGVWTRRFLAGGALRKRGIKGKFSVYVVGLGYRGTRIHEAMVGYLKAVATDKPDLITIDNKSQIDGATVSYGGAGHIVGYIGHDYFMDVSDLSDLYRYAVGDSRLHKGIFGLACVSDYYFRPGIQRRNTHIFALNKSLTYPSAFTVVGIINGVVAGKTLKGVHREAARAFATGQDKSLGTMLRALTYGDRVLE